MTLLKPGVMKLVVFTGFAGVMVAPGNLHPFLLVITLLSIAAGSGAGGAFNMWYDRDIDAIMARTTARPLPAGRVTPDNALALGWVLSLFSVMLLGLATNWLAAGMLAFAIFFYAVVYTMWLKRSTPQNIVIGGAAGAFPPVIGWAAVTGDVSWYSLVLFLIIFLWTPPHFWALALYRNSDYARAGIPMMPVTAGPDATRRQMLIYTYLLVIVTALPVIMHESGLLYALAALILGYGFIRRTWRVYAQKTDAAAKSLFLYSIFYLFALFSFLVIDKWVDNYVQLALT
jgi:protoheme IX farnesyltransferase